MTEVFESSPAELRRPSRPWRRHAPTFNASIVLASVIPSAIAGAVWIGTSVPRPLIFVLVLLPAQLMAAATAAWVNRGRRSIADSSLIVLALSATIFTLVILASLVLSLIMRGLRALSAHFLYQNSVYISPSTSLEYGGIGHAMVGTLLILTIASLIAVPIGIATALYITEVRGRAVPYVRFFVQAMSGVPSVVAGLFILTIAVATGLFSQNAFAGGLAYAILMLPTVARTAEEVLRLVPDDLRTGALALGSTRARTVFRVVLPAARTGIVTAILLGIARVIGETAPLLLAAGNSDATIINPFGDAIASIPVFIFINVAVPYPDAVARAWGAALTLMLLVTVLFVLARLVGRRRSRR